MASWQAHALTQFLKFQFKRKMRPGADIAQVRATMETFKHKVPAGVVAELSSIGGVAGEWLRPAQPTDATLLYLHGGAYFACSSATHRPITAGFARRGLQVFAANYRLAPEHLFPAAVDDAVAAYRGLIASGIPASRLTLAGDSAGGGLALATLLSLRDAGDPLPAAAVLFSPWTDLAATGASIAANGRRDAMFSGQGADQAGRVYLGGADPRDPLASPLYAELHGLPPLLIHTGSYEILLDDSIRVVERARQAGTDVQFQTWPVVPHVWQLFQFLPEARQSMDEAGRFLREATAPARERIAA